MIPDIAILSVAVTLAVTSSVLINRAFPPAQKARGVGEREIGALRRQVEELLDTVEEIQRGKRERDSEIAQLRVMLASLQDENEKLRIENKALQTEIAELRTLYMRTRRSF